jgi:hypothetical protein
MADDSHRVTAKYAAEILEKLIKQAFIPESNNKCRISVQNMIGQLLCP